MNSYPWQRHTCLRFLLAFQLPVAVISAQTAPQLDAVASDPVRMGWMVGAPPPPEKVIRFSDGGHRRFPESRWAFSHQREFVPTVVIGRGPGPSSHLPRNERADIDAVKFYPIGSKESMSWSQSLLKNYTDAIIVLHRGQIVYERYFGVQAPDRQHAVFSVTKSFVGVLAATMVIEGTLDESALVSQYLPELKDSAFGSATVRHLMDMTTGVRFDEDYNKPDAEIWAFNRAGNLLPRPANYSGPESFYAHLRMLKNEAEHGSRFAYRTPTTNALSWILHRISGKPFAQLLHERIWSKLGVEQDAYCTIDSAGTEHTGGGLNATLRDFARFGEMMRLEGRYNGQQMVPKAVIDDIRRGGNRDLFARGGPSTKPGWSYRSMWWVSHNEHGTFDARGSYGQVIYVDPTAEMVIVRFASHPLASSTHNDPTSLPAYHALAKHLMKYAQ